MARRPVRPHLVWECQVVQYGAAGRVRRQVTGEEGEGWGGVKPAGDEAVGLISWEIILQVSTEGYVTDCSGRICLSYLVTASF